MIKLKLYPAQNQVKVKWDWSEDRIKTNVNNLTGNIELWTLRRSRVSNRHIEIFRGTDTTPIYTTTQYSGFSNLREILQIATDGVSYAKMDLYALFVYNKDLTNAELNQMFRFFQNFI